MTEQHHDARTDEPATELVVARSNGLDLDHLALACRTMDEGVAHVEALTGATPLVLPAESGQWYRSASLPLGPDCALEILAPNPDHDRFHPLGTMLRSFAEPRLLFWYLATSDLDRFGAAVEASGSGLHRVETIGSATGITDDDQPIAYTRAQVGKRFTSAVPLVIEWRHRHDREGTDRRCDVTSFVASHPDADRHNQVLAAVGARARLVVGAHRLRLGLSTPNGDVTIDSAGFDATPPAMVAGLLRGWRAHRSR
ncbi:MAG: VOC family protein [Actinomycetota bacterium]